MWKILTDYSRPGSGMRHSVPGRTSSIISNTSSSSFNDDFSDDEYDDEDDEDNVDGEYELSPVVIMQFVEFDRKIHTQNFIFL